MQLIAFLSVAFPQLVAAIALPATTTEVDPKTGYLLDFSGSAQTNSLRNTITPSPFDPLDKCYKSTYHPYCLCPCTRYCYTWKVGKCQELSSA